jgi:hypothetical protein
VIGRLVTAYYLCCLGIGISTGYGLYYGNGYLSLNVVLFLALALNYRREIRRCVE